MKCVVFGGGGFIGSTIVDRLLRDGHEVSIFERPAVNAYREFTDYEKVDWVHGDFQSTYDVSNVIDGADVVLHLISTTLPKSSSDDPIYDVQSNLVSSLQLLDAMVAKSVRKIIFISSGGTVYGIPDYLPIDEKHPTNPQVSYGVTKLAIEKYLNIYERTHGIKSIVLRVSNPYGARQSLTSAQGVVAAFLNNAINKVPIEIWGDGSVIRDYIYIDDVVDAFAKALEYNGKESVFNIGSGVGVSLNDLINTLKGSFGGKIECNYLPGRSIDIPVNILSNKLAQEELGWSPVVSMVDGIRNTIRWIQSE